MNFEKFVKISGNNLSKQIIEIIDDNETISATLCIHLVCEKLLEAWICGVCNKDNFFYLGDDRIIVDFSAKLKIAQALELPEPICKAISKINKIRNTIAHNQNIKGIEQKDFDSLASLLDNFLYENELKIIEKQIEIFDKKTSAKKMYIYKNTETPDKIKLLMVLLCLIDKIFNAAHKIAK